MLKTNLASRPFYNERLVYVCLLLVALIAVVVLLTGVIRMSDLVRESRGLSMEVVLEAEQELEIQRDIDELQEQINSLEIQRLASSSREANVLIERRMFSWTEFFNKVEATLPNEVMLTSLMQNIESDSIEVSLGVIGRNVEFIDEFVKNLESTGSFSSVLSREEELTDQGTYRAVLVGRYFPRGLNEGVELESSTLISEPSV